jgi:hypothetical protein
MIPRAALLLSLPCLLVAQTPEPVPEALQKAWPKLQEWAGKAPAEFELGRLRDFLQARRLELRAGKSPAWKPWLEKLAEAKGPELAAWARTRLVEAGVFAHYEPLLDAAVEHLQQLSRPGSKKGVLHQPIAAGGWMPGVFRIQPDSPYWVEVERQTRERADLAVNPNLYAVWCFGTFPGQRALIYDIAAKIEARPTVKSPKADAWNDPRLWIVADWAMAWGNAEDFKTLEAQIPEGPARAAFSRQVAGLKDTPAFWAKSPGPADLRRINALRAQEGQGGEPAVLENSDLKLLDEGQDVGYPPAALERSLQTTLALQLTIDNEGRIAAWRPAPGPWLGLFTPWAGPRIAQRKYAPALLNGVPQWARTTFYLNFRLEDRMGLAPQTSGRGRGGQPQR